MGAAMVTWGKEYATGVSAFDAEHQQLITMINDLHDGMRAGTAKNILVELLGKLLAYTLEHFEHEESMMTLYNYPDIAEHKFQHEYLKDQTQRFHDEAASGGASYLSLEVLVFLEDWLLHHFQHEDRRYGEFLNARGVL